jgi:hypothetical protein
VGTRNFKILHYLQLMIAATGQRTSLEEARVVLSEGLLRLWEQADLIDALLAAGKPTEEAKDLLRSMQETADELGRRIKRLVEDE